MKKILILILIINHFTICIDNIAENINKQHRPLHILFAIDKFPWYTKIPIYNLIKGLTKLGHHIDIYSEQYPEHAGTLDKWIRSFQDRIFYGDLPPLLEQYDIIFCQYGKLGNRFIEIKDQKCPQTKIVTAFRGDDISSCDITAETYQILFEKGDLFLPVCHYFKYLLERIGCDQSKIKILHSPVDVKNIEQKISRRSNINSNKINIISIARLMGKKGIDILLKGMAALKKNNSKIHCFIIGDGHKKDVFMDLAKRLDILDIVSFCGWLPHDEVIRILSESDIFVLLSATSTEGNCEGIPNALKEAMLLEKPVVTTFHAGIPEIVKNELSGFLVPERDVSSFVKKIVLLIKDEKLRLQMGRIGRKKIIEEYDTPIVCKYLQELFYDLLEKH